MESKNAKQCCISACTLLWEVTDWKEFEFLTIYLGNTFRQEYTGSITSRISSLNYSLIIEWSSSVEDDIMIFDGMS